MRLIDADWVLDHLKPYEPSDEEWIVTGGTALRLIHNAVDNAPTVDAVVITRCKGCKYYKSGKLLYPNKFCFRLKHPTENRAIGYNFGPDDFCSYGERKDGGNEDR